MQDTLFSQGDGGPADARLDGSLASRVALQVSSAQVAMSEGRTAVLTVSLSERPPAAVTVSASPSIAAKLGVAPAQLTIAPDEFATPRMLTLSALEDADATDEALTLTVAAPGLAAVNVAVTIDDNDGLALVTSPAAGLELTEGLTETLAVRLSAQPAGPVTTQLLSGNGAVVSLSPSSLTFTPSDWDRDQLVTVTGRDDANTSDDTAMLAVTGTGVADLAVPVKVFDDDVQGLVPSTTNLGVVAEGGSRSFTVRLTQAPAGAVTVSAQSSVASLVTSPASLTFTAASWNVPQTITASAPEDVNLVGASATVMLTSLGMTPRGVIAGVTDNDTQQLVAAPASLSVTEGQTGTVGVRLAFQPEADTTVTVASAAPDAATATPSTLVFTPASYATSQQVTITGMQDPDAAPDATTLRLSADALVADVPVTVVEDDSLDLQTSVTALSVGEAGSTTFGVRLTAMPLTAVTVTVASPAPGALSVTPAQLTFDGSNWNTYQPVTVAGVDDADVETEIVAVPVSAPGLLTRTVQVTVTDDDVQELMVSTASVSLAEGASTTATVRLRYQPAAAVTVTLSSSNPAVTASPTTLTFTPADYATPKAVTLAAVQDANAASDTATITIATPGVGPATIAVAVADDDTLAILASPSSVTVIEGQSAALQVRLTAQPLVTTTVTVTAQDGQVAAVAPATLTFTTASWSTPQTVNVSGVHDPDAVAESTTALLRATGLSDVSVPTNVVEDDSLDILPTVTSVSLGERGQANFGVRLGAQPPSDVVVTLASGDVTAATVSPTSLTFTSANWNVGQNVTVSGVNDPDPDHETVTISLSAPGLSPRTVVASVIDDDPLAVLFSTSSFTMGEGGTGAVGVYLGAQPAGNVTVTVTSSDTSALTVSPATYTFTPSNYSQFQQVNLRGEQDADATSENVTLTAAGPGLTTGTMTVTVADDDPMMLVLSAGPTSVSESGTGTFTIQLSAQPEGDVVVDFGSSDLSALTPSPFAVVFTPGNWNVARVITLVGVDDADLDHETVAIEARTMVGIPSRTFNVPVSDDDLLSLSRGSMTLCEGVGIAAAAIPIDEYYLGVSLGNSPFGGATTVTVTSANLALAMPDPPSLGFTTAGAANVFIGTGQVTATDSTTITVSAPGLVPRTIGVTVLDGNDPACRVTTPFCGDGICNGSETYGSCPEDCPCISPNAAAPPCPLGTAPATAR